MGFATCLIWEFFEKILNLNGSSLKQVLFLYIYAMTIQEIKAELLKLPISERKRVIAEAQNNKVEPQQLTSYQDSHREMLNNKQGVCPHCGDNKYVKFGFKSRSQRYKCKSCRRSFTEYSGTWIAGIHHKDKLDDYLGLMLEEQSLDKIKAALSINKKTAFDWRHKVLASLSESDKDDFTGITERVMKLSS
tara:strand:- start:4640 stop:5212 length:573 start_codon:yes stop_codon:yes gene_type:complete